MASIISSVMSFQLARMTITDNFLLLRFCCVLQESYSRNPDLVRVRALHSHELRPNPEVLRCYACPSRALWKTRLRVCAAASSRDQAFRRRKGSFSKTHFSDYRGLHFTSFVVDDGIAIIPANLLRTIGYSARALPLEQEKLADSDGVKVRLGMIAFGGKQKGVDAPFLRLVKQRRDGQSCTPKNKRTAHFPRISFDCRTTVPVCCHYLLHRVNFASLASGKHYTCEPSICMACEIQFAAAVYLGIRHKSASAITAITPQSVPA